MSFVGLTRFGGFARILVVGEAGEVGESVVVGQVFYLVKFVRLLRLVRFSSL